MIGKVGETKVEEEVVVRAEWGNHIEFFLTSLGLAVGLGNIWRYSVNHKTTSTV